jgi:hypothetical protein
VKCVFLEYAHYQKGYILQQEHDNKIVVRRDVTFDEGSTRSPHQPAVTEDPDPMAIVYEFEINHIQANFQKRTLKQ